MASVQTRCVEAEQLGTELPVTSAAAVMMIGVCSVVATLSALDFEEMGVGLAPAVLIDATIVRAVVLPASMKPPGDLIFWVPRSASNPYPKQPDPRPTPRRSDF